MAMIWGLAKLAGAFVGALVIFFIVSISSGALFSMRGLDEPSYVVTPEDDAAAAPEETQTFEERMAQADIKAGERVFKECRACHRVEEGMNAVGPSLYGVVGRDVASIADFSYSGALDGTGDVWTPEAINEFITNPKAYAPGTAMTFTGLKDPQDRANVIAYLESVGS